MFPIIPANTATASLPENDEGIFAGGLKTSWTKTNETNLVSNAGVVASDVTGVGTARYPTAACEFGYDKGIFGYGRSSGGVTNVSMTNLVSNAGVVSSDVTGVGTARGYLAACSFN